MEMPKAIDRKTRVKVMIADSSPSACRAFTEMVDTAPDMHVVATAPDAFVAREKIKQHDPDVLLLAVELPRMDGITFLKNIMRLRPMPVIMMVESTLKDSERRALEHGAVDTLVKPGTGANGGKFALSNELLKKIRLAVGKQQAEKKVTQAPIRVEERYTADAILPRRDADLITTQEKIVAIGASTGGTEAIKTVVTALPANFSAILITQHIPSRFSESFAARLDSLSQMGVCQATDGQPISPGNVYIAPGDQHLLVRREGQKYFCQLHDGPLVNRHKPSVDVLFRSVAQSAGKNATGVILTGMGDDGAVGMQELQATGAYTIAQDEKSSVVWGMPGSAVRLGAADEVLPLDAIAGRILERPTSGRLQKVSSIVGKASTG